MEGHSIRKTGRDAISRCAMEAPIKCGIVKPTSSTTGYVTTLNPTGWVAITPDGNYLVTAAGPNKEHYSYAIDHINAEH